MDVSSCRRIYFIFNAALCFLIAPDCGFALDLDLYAERAMWRYDLPQGSSMSSYDDSWMARFRLLFRDHQEVIRPFLSISGQGESVDGAAGYKRIISRYGGGIRFSKTDMPIKLFVEARHSEQSSVGYSVRRSSNEGLATLAFNGQTGSHDHDALVASWYVDVSQIASVDSKSYAAGSGWLRVSAVSIGDSSFHFMMDPFDLAAYRECLDGCRDWVFAGVGLAATYSSESLLVSLRTNLGERVDTNESGKIRFRDAARILLVFQGEF